MTKPYTPQADSVPGRVIALLAADPSERMTKDALAARFGRHHSAMHSLLAAALEARYLAREENEDGELAYFLGPVASGLVAATPLLADSYAKPWAPSAPKMKQTRKPAGPRADPFVCDPSKIPLKSGVPLPVVRTAVGTDWTVLMARMAVGQCCELPNAAKSGLSGAITKAKRAGAGLFKLRKLSPEVLGLWRVG